MSPGDPDYSEIKNQESLPGQEEPFFLTGEGFLRFRGLAPVMGTIMSLPVAVTAFMPFPVMMALCLI